MTPMRVLFLALVALAALALWVAQRMSELRCNVENITQRVKQLEIPHAAKLAKKLRITPKDWSDDKLKTRVAEKRKP